MKIVCIIQARTTSSRLPNKVLLKLPYSSEKTVLENVIERVKKSSYINDVVIATTINKTDDKIEEVAKKNKIHYYRGSEKNVLERYYEAAKSIEADVIVRITSDCPCIDYEVIDRVIEYHLKNLCDYTSNSLERSFPHGLDCEVLSFKCLEEAYNNAKEDYEIEHVTPYIYRGKIKKYKVANIKSKKDYSNIRITLDTKEDYNLICAVYDYLYEKNNLFKMSDIIKLFEEKGWLYNLNNNIEQKKVCLNLKEELEEGLKILKKQDLFKVVKILESEYEKDYDIGSE